MKSAATALALALSCSCAGAGRDVVPESRDVTVRVAAPARSDQGYEYVARRALSVVALAEARGIDPQVARAVVDQLADRLDACVTEHANGGAPSRGAARVVARVDRDGRVAGVSLRVDPGAGVASSAVLCLVAPARLTTFPPAASDDRGFAIEALWGQLGR